MPGYIGNVPVPQATQVRDNFTATSGQTSFNTSGYSPGYIDVYLNGIHLDPSDYTATDGATVVLNSGATAGDVLSVVAFSTFNLSSGTFTVPAKGVVTTDNDGSFDLSTGNYFICTPTADVDLTFTSEAAGQSGLIYFSNTTNFIVTADADVHISAGDLTTLSVTGNYIVTYYCPDGINVYLSASGALTEGS